MSCVIGGKCNDGVVMVSDSKITYDDHPPSHGNKLSPFYHIVMGGAGSTDLYNEFKINVLYAAQPNVKIPEGESRCSV